MLFFKNKKNEVPKVLKYKIDFYQDNYEDYFFLKEIDNSIHEIAFITYRKNEKDYAVRNIGNENERLIVAVGDISKIKCDCVVNAAKPSLLGGGGVDGAIHYAAGPELLKECKTLGGCEEGNAKITNAYNMHCKKIIHTVGPIWHGGERNEAETLKNCYINSLNLAIQNNLKTIAFPAISCGNYGYPSDQGITIALNTAMEFLDKYEDIKIIFVVNNIMYNVIQKEINNC